MPDSLQDQLKKAGLVDDKKARQLKRARNKQEKLARKSKSPSVDQVRLELERARSEKIERDRQLNLEKNRKAEQVALAAQIRQLIEMNIVAKEGDQKFNFSDAGVIKHIYVGQQQIDQLSRGALAIVARKDGQSQNYVLVPMAVAEKIEQRDAKAVIFKAQKNTSSEEDEFYADYKIPDDLTW